MIPASAWSDVVVAARRQEHDAVTVDAVRAWSLTATWAEAQFAFAADVEMREQDRTERWTRYDNTVSVVDVAESFLDVS